MISMTGYGRGSAAEGEYEVTAETSSVNKRNLDISVSLPREWRELEAGVAERVRRAVHRGKVYVAIAAARRSGASGPDWSGEAVESVLGRLRDLAESSGVAFEPDAKLLYQVARDCSESAALPTAEAVRACVDAAVEQALREMTAMREKEGAALASDLAARTEQLAARTAEIESNAEGMVPHYREVLHRRLKQAGLELDPEDERVLKEIALFADRCDISEEITRLKSHLDQLASWLREEAEPVGRKCDFLVQEINREFNTIGSKVTDTRISRHVIDCKNELERIREQLQNVE